MQSKRKILAIKNIMANYGIQFGRDKSLFSKGL